jgi:PadR family transcriptional regulator
MPVRQRVSAPVDLACAGFIYKIEILQHGRCFVGKTGVLGAFEEMVLLAVLRQAEAAYGVSIRRELVDRSGSEVTMGAVYATLDRLEGKGLIAAVDGEERESRRGRPRRYYMILLEGVSALDETRRIREAMWQDIDLSALDSGQTG